MTKPKKPIPFDFVLEALYGVNPYTKPMFGCTAVYVDGKIVLILREREEHLEDNGVWLATTKEHHESLKKDFPSMRSIGVFGTEVTGWQVLPSDSPDFEESVLKACEFVLAKDLRIGKITQIKVKKNNSKKKLKTKPTKSKPNKRNSKKKKFK